jgi:hypothetical protein
MNLVIMTPCSLLAGYQCFKEHIYCLHILQRQTEAACSSKELEPTRNSTWCHETPHLQIQNFVQIFKSRNSIFTLFQKSCFCHFHLKSSWLRHDVITNCTILKMPACSDIQNHHIYTQCSKNPFACYRAETQGKTG